MGPIEQSWQNYKRQRRRLNTRLGLVVFALLPLPAVLLTVGFSPLRMLLAVASLGMSIGILYPLWWRTKNHPLRASAVEARTRRIAWICRPSGFFCGLAAMLSWSMGSRAAEWAGVALGAAATLLVWFAYSADRKEKENLRSASACD